MGTSLGASPLKASNFYLCLFKASSGLPSRDLKSGLPYSKPRRTLYEPRRTLCEPRRTLCEPRRTLCEPRRTLMSHAAPCAEPRRTLIATPHPMPRRLECVGHSFAYVAHLVFLRDVWIRTNSPPISLKKYKLMFKHLQYKLFLQNLK
jgi:hypothetical protein